MNGKKAIYILHGAIVAFWLAAVAFAIYVYVKNPIENNVYGFLIHDESLFHCPSCGLTRAVYSLMRFDIASAFYYHAYFTVTSPVWAYTLVCLTANLWKGKRVIPYPSWYKIALGTFRIIHGVYRFQKFSRFCLLILSKIKKPHKNDCFF